MDKNLNLLGFSRDEITDVFLTHLHFDHCGGSIVWNTNKTLLIPAFKNAVYWSNDRHWKWATQPNSREKASFLKENILPIEESGQLKFIYRPENGFLKQSELGFDILFADGHTDAQMIPHIYYKGKTIILPLIYCLPSDISLYLTLWAMTRVPY